MKTYTFTFRHCDIVPELARRDNSWEKNGQSHAVNEVLRIRPNRILWEVVSSSSDANQNTYTMTLRCSQEDEHAFIVQKYAEYCELHGIEKNVAE
jgi:hypothetical protein